MEREGVRKMAKKPIRVVSPAEITDAQAAFIYETLIRLWYHQHGIELSKVTVYRKEDKEAL